MKVPPYLKKGDTIGIVCPAGFMPFEKMQQCIQTLQRWGFGVVEGKTVHSRFNYFSGTDEERLQDLQQMMDDENVKAILCARGGYGLSRIIDAVNFTRFKKNPKWIIGFSDVTVLHAHLNKKIKVASLHAPMASAFNNGENFFVQSLHKALTGKKANYNCAVHALNKIGKCTGELVGGNLSIIAHLIGSSSEIDTNNKILFLEDVGEYLYNIDRMLIQLKRTKKMENLCGLVIGGFTEMKDTTISFGKNVYEIIYDVIKDYNYPVCFNFPVSHTEKNYALKIGMNYQLSVTKNKVYLKEN